MIASALHVTARRHLWVASLRIAIAALTGLSARGDETAAAKPLCPPIQRLSWHAPQRIDWRLAQKPAWFSLGHINRVLCCLPNGVRETGGKTVNTRDGSGRIVSVDFEVYEVTAFDPATGLPAATRLLAKQTVRADDPEALKRKQWEFPHEQKFDWELSLLPVKAHQSLLRIFLHEEQPFWHTLMIHTEADLEPAAPGIGPVFKDFLTHIIVCELLHDPGLPLTSRYIEPNDPPSTTWIEGQRVKAPWAASRDSLEPARGSLTFDADGSMRFIALTDAARAAEKLPMDGGKVKIALPEMNMDITTKGNELDASVTLGTGP